MNFSVELAPVFHIWNGDDFGFSRADYTIYAMWFQVVGHKIHSENKNTHRNKNDTKKREQQKRLRANKWQLIYLAHFITIFE